ncbi:hypothetical protein [Tabrizicola sp.]|uniref:hypothetical protein n=1 Tax=Tabrizicola sp. TaxID=2005166 RepID=UPI001A4B6231|nr:hypothetical protein [Tabrizicola sp.]MBL9072573.1 hypothetical protein [Tabrizicola sp.]
MSLTELTLAVLALLLTPGPTNSLVLLAGGERGWPGALRLVPAELSGYLVTVLPLAVMGATLFADHDALRTAVTLAAALWVAVLAVKLWQMPEVAGDGMSVGGSALFVTTALNPKALIFGLVLLPSPDRIAANLAIFTTLVVAVAIFWAGLGAALRKGGSGQPRAIPLLRRLASVWLAAISVVLIARGMGA